MEVLPKFWSWLTVQSSGFFFSHWSSLQSTPLIDSFASHSSSLSSFDCPASIMLASIVKSGERMSVQKEFYHDEDKEPAPLGSQWLLQLFGIASLSEEEANKVLQPYVHFKAIKDPKSPQVVRHRSMFGHPVSCSQVGFNKTDTPGTLYYQPKKAALYSASIEEVEKINPINLPPNTLAWFELLQQHPVGGLLCVVQLTAANSLPFITCLCAPTFTPVEVSDKNELIGHSLSEIWDELVLQMMPVNPDNPHCPFVAGAGSYSRSHTEKKPQVWIEHSMPYLFAAGESVIEMVTYDEHKVFKAIFLP